MQIGLWELRELKRALATFCDDNKLELGDEIALKAAQQLLQFAQQGAQSSDQLLRQLRSQDVGPPQKFGCSEPAVRQNKDAHPPPR